MKTFISKVQKRFFELSVRNVEAELIYFYIIRKKIDIRQSLILTQYMELNRSGNDDIERYIYDNAPISKIDDLITAFEMLINIKDKKNNGVVYTPVNIKEYIVRNVIVSNEIPTVVDPACGCGSFLITAAKWMHKKYKLSYSEIFGRYIFGFDIDEHSIEKAKLLFELLSLEEDGSSIQSEVQLCVADSLSEFSKKKYINKYDVVIGNPPYVRAKNIDDRVKPHLKKWSVVTGNVDLYIPFYEIALRILKSTGIMGYISPNTFLQSVNGRSLRNYFVKNGYDIKILDFKEAQAFKEVTHYTCICIINKDKIHSKINYALLNGKSSLSDYSFTEYDISKYQENKEWRFANPKIDEVIRRIENQPIKLNDYRIRNGLATLCNEVYFFDPIDENEQFFYRKYKGKLYPIEKEICIDVIKPNIIRSEADIEKFKQKAIFPYGKEREIIDEEYLEKKYPMAYNFLCLNKEKLLKRDKGRADEYVAWYAYGRKQGMTNQGRKLLIPYMAEKGVAVKSMDEHMLFYCGYAIFCDDIEEMELLKIFIQSDVFLYYIKNTSKPYSKGYMALAKNYIKNFGLPKLDNHQKKYLLSSNGKDRQNFIKSLYNVAI